MIEMRLHGRGGQGVVIGGKLLARALLEEGKYVVYFPEFGAERRGSPVKTFLRVSESPILLKQQIYEPDIVVVMDSTLDIHQCIAGMKPDGLLIINSANSPESFQALGPFKIHTIDATRIARKHRIGTINAPIVNTTMIGIIASLLKISFEPVANAITKGIRAYEKNIDSAREAYNYLKEQS
jgi:2-oxoacid:acceptor oxidoreductase gamma subunit (pyruvate/2-ketoisovalerate family)